MSRKHNTPSCARRTEKTEISRLVVLWLRGWGSNPRPRDYSLTTGLCHHLALRRELGASPTQPYGCCRVLPFGIVSTPSAYHVWYTAWLGVGRTGVHRIHPIFSPPMNIGECCLRRRPHPTLSLIRRGGEKRRSCVGLATSQF